MKRPAARAHERALAKARFEPGTQPELQAPEPAIRRIPDNSSRGGIWTPDRIALLGAMPDRALARVVGVSKAAVGDQRRRRQISGYSQRQHIAWTKEQIALLGTDTDTAIAIELGLSRPAVSRKRRSLGLPSVSERSVARIAWTRAADRLLGRVSDADAAKRLGVSDVSVRTRRKILGKPPFVPAPEPTRWTPRMIEDLRVLSDAEMSRRYRISPRVVSLQRQRLAIFNPNPRRAHILRTRALRKLLPTSSTAEIHREHGLAVITIKRLRLELGVPERRPEPWWSKAKGRFGKVSDLELARELGVSPTSVHDRRVKLGIAPFQPQHAWTKADEALLGRLSDQEAARRIGVSINAVQQRRSQLGLVRGSKR